MTPEDLENLSIENATYLESLLAQYQESPHNVDSSWQPFFSPLVKERKIEPLIGGIEKVIVDTGRIERVINIYRTFGHLYAKTNPLATSNKELPWQLNLETYGFKASDKTKLYPTMGLLNDEMAPLESIVSALQKIYSDTIGIEYMGMQDLALEKWVQNKIEPNHFDINLDIDEKRMILDYLNKSELFEIFLHTKYTGQKRFSLEGGETLIPIMAAMLEKGALLNAETFIIGMAHRGRLNVLCNILQKSYSDVFSEFEEGYIPDTFEGSGDVKYHKGYTSQFKTKNGHSVEIVLAPNPSHLEAVNPVVEGEVYARQELVKDKDKTKVVPVLIHGDAAVSGQGIVYEVLQMYALKGYGTGGTIHLIINNQIGFTTKPHDSRSTTYCSDIAKTFRAPVFHVNAEDPEGCYAAILLAMEIRQTFHCDVFIDLQCYRKFGHNESDEPAFTQPLEYEIIRQKKPIRELYRDNLIEQGVLEKEMALALEEEFKNSLNKELSDLRLHKSKITAKKESAKPLPKKMVSTQLDVNIIKQVGRDITTIPETFTIHNRLGKIINQRRGMLDDDKSHIDWGMAENLAYATLVYQGKRVRLSGQDCGRGTFSHRHAEWIDQETEEKYCPLNHVKGAQGIFAVYNSLLSEYAVLGFEYGYSLADEKALVIWEAQFGDFCNGAQVIIDQFVSTAEQKWAQRSGIVMLLPHGYEGQGPEHSSARLERFLTLSGDENMVVVNPTTPAQLYHLLRRQVLQPMLKPLIIFSPKALLRHPLCVSSITDLAEGEFCDVLDDPFSGKKPKTIVFCAGKMFYEMHAEREKRQRDDLVFIRLDQLYPFPEKSIRSILKKYKSCKHCVWAQEEPKNMGAWNFIQPRLSALLADKWTFKYVGRARSASPAAGSLALHKKELKELFDELFGGKN